MKFVWFIFFIKIFGKEQKDTVTLIASKAVSILKMLIKENIDLLKITVEIVNNTYSFLQNILFWLRKYHKQVYFSFYCINIQETGIADLKYKQ